MIKLLSDRTINRIAAGEIIERPYAVLKELVENAIDARPTSIDVTLLGGGYTSITVSDNGCGIPSEQLELAITRHATSKLDEERIYDIKHMGFRGEALASICAVSNVTLMSRPKEQDIGWAIAIHNGELIGDRPVPMDYGTIVEVRDLFANMPAKLRFMRSSRSEEMACADLMHRISVAHPEISFSLKFDDKSVIAHTLYRNSCDIPTIRAEKLKAIFGEEFSKNARLVEYEDDYIKIYGMVGLPTKTASNSNYQYFYVNKRIIKDKFLTMTAKLAYQGLMHEGRYPYMVLMLEIDPINVDVNVHPNKLEVRFQNEANVRAKIISAIRNAIKMIEPDIKHDEGAGRYANNYGNNYAYYTDSVMNQYDNTSHIKEHSLAEGEYNYSVKATGIQCDNTDANVENAPNIECKIIDEKAVGQGYLGVPILQLQNTYIITKTDEAFFVIDQHAAHERIILERMKDGIKSNGIAVQYILLPYIMDMKHSRYAMLYDNIELCKRLGFILQKNGVNEIALIGVPEVLKFCESEALIEDLIISISEHSAEYDIEHKIEAILANIACKASIKAGKTLSMAEMNILLRTMEELPFSGQCNHGRPTYIKMSKSDLDRLFER